MAKITAIGELLIDFTPVSRVGLNPCFEQNPGGAPANVLAAMARLGHETAFIGKVGKDDFGYFLKSVMDQEGIRTAQLKMTGDAKTTLAFVHLKPDGDRSFTFFRDPGADRLLTVDDLDMDVIRTSEILHFGAVSLTHEPARTATLAAAKAARAAGVTVTYDPNLRPALWESMEEARRWTEAGLELAHWVKVSEEELAWLTGTEDICQGSAVLAERWQLDLLFITMGSQGSAFRQGRRFGKASGFRVSAVDATGAGDAFMGAALHAVLSSGKKPEAMSEQELASVVTFGNAAGAEVVQRKGAITVMPGREMIEARIRMG